MLRRQAMELISRVSTVRELGRKRSPSLHINVLELEAVHRALVHFLPVLKNQKVLVRSDNVTVVQYLNKQGGTRSPNLCFRVWNLFLFAIQNQIELESSIYSREVERLADHLSRKQIRPSEWSINNQVINQICGTKPLIDLFASAQNHKTPVFCTWFSKSGGSSSRRTVNSMGGNVRLCISSHRTNSEGSGTHVTVQLPDDSDSSFMATSSLVHKVASTSDRHSKKSSAKRRSSKSAKHKDISPKSRNSETIGMAALNSNLKSAGFSKKVRKLLAASWRKGTKKDYCCKFRKFNSWCVERHKDPYSASLTDCAEFLTFLFEEGLQYRTIGGYRSMLSSVLHL